MFNPIFFFFFLRGTLPPLRINIYLTQKDVDFQKTALNNQKSARPLPGFRLSLSGLSLWAESALLCVRLVISGNRNSNNKTIMITVIIPIMMVVMMLMIRKQ